MTGALQRVASTDVGKPLGHTRLPPHHLGEYDAIEPRRNPRLAWEVKSGNSMTVTLERACTVSRANSKRRCGDHVSAERKFDDDARAVRQHLAGNCPSADEEKEDAVYRPHNRRWFHRGHTCAEYRPSVPISDGIDRDSKPVGALWKPEVVIHALEPHTISGRFQ